jgi:Fur family ferric uptake transcriptional regulator
MEQRHELRKAGLKITLPRLKILEILENASNRHLSAEDIYKDLLDSGEEIGLATVYRVLTQFEAAGLVTRHNFEGGHSVFELDDGEHHDHMVCVETGEVIEFTSDEIERLPATPTTNNARTPLRRAFSARQPASRLRARASLP